MPMVMRSDFTGQADPNADNYGHPDPYGLAGFMKSNPDEFYRMQNSGMGLDQIQKAIGGQANSGYQGLSGMYQQGNPLYDMKGAGALPGGVGGGTTSLATGGSVGSGSGPYKADAQLAQVNSEFAGIMKRGLGQLNEQAAMGGGFAGGIPFDKRQQFITDTGNSQNASIERIMNDILGRNQSWDLSQKEMALRAAGGGGSQSQRYGNANENQQIMDAYSSKGSGGTMQGGGGGGGMTGGGGGQTVFADPVTGEPNKNDPNYFNNWQKWFREKGMAKQAGSAAMGAMSGAADAFGSIW